MSKAESGASLVTGAMQERRRAVEEVPQRSAQSEVGTVRQTVDLPAAHHVELAHWRMETAVELGRSNLTTQEVLSALVALVLSDETVARRARAQIGRTPPRRRKRRTGGQ